MRILALFLAFALPAHAQLEEPPKPTPLKWKLAANTAYSFSLRSTLTLTVAGKDGPQVTVHELIAEATLTLASTEEVHRAQGAVTGTAKWKKKLHPKHVIATGELKFDKIEVTITKDGKVEKLVATPPQLKLRSAAAKLSDYGALTLDLDRFDDEPFDSMDLDDHLGGLMLGLPRDRGVRAKGQAVRDSWLVDIDGENSLYRLRLDKVEGLEGSRSAKISGICHDQKRFRLTDGGRTRIERRGTLTADFALDAGHLASLTSEHSEVHRPRAGGKQTRSDKRKRVLSVTRK